MTTIDNEPVGEPTNNQIKGCIRLIDGKVPDNSELNRCSFIAETINCEEELHSRLRGNSLIFFLFIKSIHNKRLTEKL